MRYGIHKESMENQQTKRVMMKKMTKVLIPQNIGESGLHVVTPLSNVTTMKNIQIMEPVLDVTTSVRDVATSLPKIDCQMASFSVSASSLAIEFQEDDMDNYLQQLQPYTFIQE
ncbi:hypothetical protein Golax_023029 [Gossypium laxum]|uniref:Uncharacterized protein n=1 Tax=Gossypium laxum TaxID=34288 RepID=A0A7J9B5W7_9ROSI|nr:hypothetical protein [Gossypium laxum]